MAEIAHNDLTWLGVRRETCRDVNRITYRTDVGPAEGAQRIHLNVAKGNANMTSMH
jgi:hypothetical protein